MLCVLYYNLYSMLMLSSVYWTVYFMHVILHCVLLTLPYESRYFVVYIHYWHVCYIIFISTLLLCTYVLIIFIYTLLNNLLLFLYNIVITSIHSYLYRLRKLSKMKMMQSIVQWQEEARIGNKRGERQNIVQWQERARIGNKRGKGRA